MGRFDYVRYSPKAEATQIVLKEQFVSLEHILDTTLAEGRAKSLAMTKLEETYMWVGKALRDEQVSAAKQKGEMAELMEGRKDG